MIDERLYIDNKLVDIDTGTKVTMSIKSNLFRDVSKIASNNTYTVRLPKTVRNQMILGHADLVQSQEGYAYTSHKARYFRNGVEVIKDGKVTVLKVSENSIEISILWGLFGSFSQLLKDGTTLNQLSSDAKILYNKANTPINFEESKTEGYFYANYDVWNNEAVIDYKWSSGCNMLSPRIGNNIETESYGRYKIEKKDGDALYNLHPVVKVSWLLEQIKKDKGVDFRFSREAKEYIDTLVIPLISRKSNELTFQGGYEAELLPTKRIGAITQNVIEPNDVLNVHSGDQIEEFRVNADVNIIFDIRGKWAFDLEDVRPIGFVGGGTFGGKDGVTTDNRCDDYAFAYGAWLKVVVRNGGEEEEYVIGNDKEHFRVTVPQGYKGACSYENKGYGKIEIKKDSTVSVEWITQGFLKNARFTGGYMKATMLAGDDVPVGGYFPIIYNLPKIKVVDFVKFLAAVTGTFPLQMSENKVVNFVPLSTIWENKREAKDWTRRLIAQGAENKPKSIDFNVNEYAQNNLYKWKEDERTKGNYNGNLKVSNDTLDKEKVAFEFPFAATDGNNVPMYGEGESKSTELSGGVELGNKKGEITKDKGPTYKACKDRILRIKADEKGKTMAFFDINMQEIIDTKYRNIVDSLQRVKLITETIKIRELELVNFDETKPIYLAQYGSYFAITEIKADDTGLAEVTMLQLYYNI